jgi:hypothetical protein
MKITKLHKQADFAAYSAKLQDFEGTFDYPLGDKRFSICHGQQTDNYFAFFQGLGDVNYFVIEEGDVVVGAGCAILKSRIEFDMPVSYWYLCDFKISKAYRKKGLLKKIMLRHFISHYLKSNKMITVNMSPRQNNGLVNNVMKLFSWFNIISSPLYFYEWDKNTFLALLENHPFIGNKFGLMTNNGVKDIIIEGRPLPLYHLVERYYAQMNYDIFLPPITKDALKFIAEEATFMFATANSSFVTTLKEKAILHTSEATIISHGINIQASNFFTGEI